jgi:hypothetical protein
MSENETYFCKSEETESYQWTVNSNSTINSDNCKYIHKFKREKADRVLKQCFLLMSKKISSEAVSAYIDYQKLWQLHPYLQEREEIQNCSVHRYGLLHAKQLQLLQTLLQKRVMVVGEGGAEK